METDLDSLTLILSKISVRSTWIHVDLWPEIFKRLPTKTLGRFRCVCKSWNSVISSPFFVNLHRSFFPFTTPPKLKPYLVVNYRRYALCRPQQDTLDDEHLRHDIHFPFQGRDEQIREHFCCVDVVHGVVCVSHSRYWSYDSFILWNPSIRNYITLPLLPFPFPSPLDLDPSTTDDVEDKFQLSCFDIGFGYDSSKNDFKVVRIQVPFSVLIEDNSVSPRYDLYSTQQGVWKTGIANNIKYGEFEVETTIRGISCFVNSTIHWLVYTIDEMYSLLMFDCEREEFRTMELPEEIFMEPTCVETIDDYWWSSELLEYVGMLSIMVNFNWFDYDNRVDMTFVELWVMEEHGVASSWRKLYKIFNNSVFDAYRPSFEELNSYGPKQLAEYPLSEGLSYRVYEENLCLMDDVKAKSYRDEEIVLI